MKTYLICTNPLSGVTLIFVLHVVESDLIQTKKTLVFVACSLCRQHSCVTEKTMLAQSQDNVSAVFPRLKHENWEIPDIYI